MYTLIFTLTVHTSKGIAIVVELRICIYARAGVEVGAETGISVEDGAETQTVDIGKD